jgi:hypothetical protein
LSDSEIMPEGCAGARRDREHGGDAGRDDDIDSAPFRRSIVDRLADGRGHGEHAGIAAGDDGDIRARRSTGERGTGAIQLLAIVGRDLLLVTAQRQAVEIGKIAEEFFSLFDSPRGFRRHLLRHARPRADDIERSRGGTSHGLPFHPGTSTIEK